MPGARPMPRSMRPGIQRLERVEHLRHVQRRVVGQHDAAGADAQRGGRAGDVRDQDLGRRTGHAGHAVVLGEPVAGEAEPLGEAAPVPRPRAGRRPSRSRRGRERDREPRAASHPQCDSAPCWPLFLAGWRRHQFNAPLSQCITLRARPWILTGLGHVHAHRALVRPRKLRTEHRRLPEHGEAPLPVIHDRSLQKVDRRDAGVRSENLNATSGSSRLYPSRKTSSGSALIEGSSLERLAGEGDHRVDAFAGASTIGDSARGQRGVGSAKRDLAAARGVEGEAILESDAERGRQRLGMPCERHMVCDQQQRASTARPIAPRQQSQPPKRPRGWAVAPNRPRSACAWRSRLRARRLERGARR